MKTTTAQQEVVSAVRAGRLTVAQTGTREGNIVRRLVDAGVLVAANRTLVGAETTYHGRRIAPAVVFSGLTVAS